MNIYKMFKLKNLKQSFIVLAFLGFISLSANATTVYEDAEQGTTTNWSIEDKKPFGSLISNVYDNEVQSNVIQFIGTGLLNSYMIGQEKGKKGWNNISEKIINWKMKYNEDYVVSVIVETTNGLRYMNYTPIDVNNGIEDNSTIHHGLGVFTKEGSWQTVSRDLNTDLKEFEIDNEILSVNGFLVRGSGFIDNIKLSNEPVIPVVSNAKKEGWFDIGFPVSSNKIAIDSNNILYMAYRDDSKSSKVTVKKYDGISWTNVGAEGFSDGNIAYDIAIAIDNNNTPYVVYEEKVLIEEFPGYFVNYWKTTVKKFDGMSWVTVGTNRVTENNTNGLSIVIDNNNVPYVVYSDSSNLGKVTVKKFDGTSWVGVGAEGISDYSARDLSIVINNNNVPYIAYTDSSASDESIRKATVKMFDGTMWKDIDNSGLSNLVESTSLSIDNNNVPYLAYTDHLNSSKATVKKFNGISWQMVGTTGLVSEPLGEFVSPAGTFTSIAIDSNNVPYVVYQNYAEYKGFVKKFDGTSWITVGNEGISETMYSDTLIAIDNNNSLYVNYRYDSSGASKLKTYKNHIENNVLENQIDVIDIDANIISNEQLSYVILESMDSSLFNIDFYTGIVTFKTAPDFENPSDLDGNNIYEFDIKVISESGEFIVQKVKIFILDEDEQAPIVPVLTITPTQTYEDVVEVEVVGEINSEIFINGVSSNVFIPISGKITITLDTSGTYGDKIFVITLKDESNNISDGLVVTINKERLLNVRKEAWSSVGIDGFATGTNSKYTSIAIDSNNIPYVAYIDHGDYGIGRTTVKKFDGSAWIAVGSEQFSAGSADYTSIAIDSNNIPYLAYQDNQYVKKITVKKFDGNSWITVGVEGFSKDEARNINIAINSNNIPYVIYQDKGNTYKASVKKFDGISWVNVGIDGFSPDVATNPKIVISSDNIPYVVYKDRSSLSRATVKKFDGTSWITVGVEGFSKDRAEFTSIAIDRNNIPYVVYYDAGNAGKATVKKFDGTSWVTVGIEGFSIASVWDTAIAIDSNNIPYVVYQDDGNLDKATVKKFNGTSWVTVGIEGFSKGLVQYSSIAIDGNNTPYVIYQDDQNDNKVTVKKFINSLRNVVSENQLVAVEMNVTDINNDIVSYSLSNSVDSSLFTINTFTGQVSFKNIPDFENPSDLDANNMYEFYVECVDNDGVISTIKVEITVENIID